MAGLRIEAGHQGDSAPTLPCQQEQHRAGARGREFEWQVLAADDTGEVSWAVQRVRDEI